MRLKKNKAVYALPRGVTPSSVILKVGKVDYPLKHVSSEDGFVFVAKTHQQEVSGIPIAWCWINPYGVLADSEAHIAIYPRPSKAWKIEVRAMKEVVL